MHRLGGTGFFLSGTLLEFRMFFCIIEEESTQDNMQDNSYTGNVFMENSHNEPKYIEVRGACVHNLKNVNVNVPLHQIVGIAGVSGSGKSSLALGVLYAEGSRRYLESLSTYTRRRMTRAAKSTGRRSAVCPGGAGCISVRAFRASAARLEREPNC